MKLYFQPPTSQWWIEFGFLKRWEERMGAVPTATEHYSIVSQSSAADICIVPWGEQITYELAQLLRPLTQKDVETIVWEFSDWPTGRESGFYCSLRRGLFDPTRHCSISYPVIFNEFVAHAPLDEATLDFGFVGQMSAGVRKRLMERFGPSLPPQRDDDRRFRRRPWTSVRWHAPRPRSAHTRSSSARRSSFFAPVVWVPRRSVSLKS